MKKLQVVLAAACITLSIPAPAAVLKGVHLPEQINAEGKTLYLNGIGARQKTVFHVDVYVAGLYLENPSRDAGAILSSNALKKLVVVFLRDATAKQVVESWNEGIHEHCGSRCGALAPSLARFDSLMTDVRRGQEVQLTFFPDHLAIASGGQSQDIPGREFAEVSLAAFIGPKTHADAVRDALLSGHLPLTAEQLPGRRAPTRS